MRKLTIPILMLSLGACNSSPNGSSEIVDAKSCAAPETFAAIQKVLFDDARKNYSGNVKYVNDIDGLFKATVYNPVLHEINKDTDKADCQGRLTLNVPSSLLEQFGRQTSLTADVGYTVQPSADGKGFVYTVGGYAEVLESVIGAAGLLEASDKSAALPDNRAVLAPPAQDVSPSNADLAEGDLVYHYVSGLDSNGDNWLALKTQPNIKSTRIAKLSPGTLLKFDGPQVGSWTHVILVDGTAGWVATKYTACCQKK